MSKATEPPPSTGVINQFTWKEKGKTVHGIPSNFYIEPDGTCVEVEYQALKHEGYPWRQKIIRAVPDDPARAKRLGRRFRLTKKELKEWDRVKGDVMLRLEREKYEDHLELRMWLMATGEAELVEGNWWHDQYWGDCQCRDHHYRIGKNVLGKILMKVREESYAF